jgi:hypothetical protein
MLPGHVLQVRLHVNKHFLCAHDAAGCMQRGSCGAAPWSRSTGVSCIVTDEAGKHGVADFVCGFCVFRCHATAALSLHAILLPRFDDCLAAPTWYLLNLAACSLSPSCCWRRYFRFYPDGTLLYRTSPLTVAKVAKSLAVRSCGSSSAQAAAAAAGAKQKLDHHVFTGKYVIKVRQGAAAAAAPRTQRGTWLVQQQSTTSFVSTQTARFCIIMHACMHA